MKAEQHRAVRHAFVARVEVVDLDSEKQIIARTGNLSAFGCFIETGVSFLRGTRIRMRITHRGTTFVAVGQVADKRANGMGVRFASMEPAHVQILENWLAQLRNGANSASHHAGKLAGRRFIDRFFLPFSTKPLMTNLRADRLESATRRPESE